MSCSSHRGLRGRKIVEEKYIHACTCANYGVIKTFIGCSYPARHTHE